MPIKRISEHRDTISCHPLCCTNDLIDMKGRCCPKIVVSIPRSLFTSGQLRHIGGTVPKTALPLWRKVCEKREVDIISRYKWWINEELHRWSFDKPLKIVYHWYLKHLWTQTFLAATKQLYKWYFPSVCLSVCPSVCPSVTPFSPCSHHRIIMKFSGVITMVKSDVHAKGQGQRSKVKVTEERSTPNLAVSGL